MPEENEPKQIALMQRMVDMAVERTRLAHERTQLAVDRTRMAADRSELSAQRSYMAAERTLSVWVRTALALMVFGIAIDRLALLLYRMPLSGGGSLEPDALSTWMGTALISFGVLMAVVTGVRFLVYVACYRHTHAVPAHHGPFLAPLFALLVALFGIGLLLLLLVFGARIS